MKSVLFFIGFTATALLYRIFPSYTTIFFSMMGVTVISAGVLSAKLTPVRSKYDPLMTGHGGTSYDMHEILCLVPIILETAFLAAAIFVPISPDIFVWTVYAVTIIINYVIPAVIYLCRRIRFYSDVREKAESHGWRLTGNFFEFIFSGRNNIHNITVETPGGMQTIGILGGVGAMRYVIEDGTVDARRVMPLAKKYAFHDYGGEEKTKVQLWGYGLKTKKRPLPESSGRAYLMLQPNAFVVSNGLLVDVGEEVEGMRLLDMETGMKIVRA